MVISGAGPLGLGMITYAKMKNLMNGNSKGDGVVSNMFVIEEWEKAFDYASGKYGDFKVAFWF